MSIIYISLTRLLELTALLAVKVHSFHQPPKTGDNLSTFSAPKIFESMNIAGIGEVAQTTELLPPTVDVYMGSVLLISFIMSLC